MLDRALGRFGNGPNFINLPGLQTDYRGAAEQPDYRFGSKQYSAARWRVLQCIRVCATPLGTVPNFLNK